MKSLLYLTIIQLGMIILKLLGIFEGSWIIVLMPIETIAPVILIIRCFVLQICNRFSHIKQILKITKKEELWKQKNTLYILE